MTNTLLTISGIFYGVLCVFSIVTGIIYMSGKRQLNPLELSDKFVEKLNNENKTKRFTFDAGLLTFIVGIVQGITSYGLFIRNGMFSYYFSLGFTIFSICSVAFKLKGKINIFPILKSIAYLSILVLLLLPQTRIMF